MMWDVRQAACIEMNGNLFDSEAMQDAILFAQSQS